MSEKIPMLMVLATLIYLASSVYGGTECLRREGPERHEDCVSFITVGATEVLQGPKGCNATDCWDSIGHNVVRIFIHIATIGSSLDSESKLSSDESQSGI